jgi:hypothetical protein
VTLTVVTPAADLALLTVAELRAAAGLSSDDTSKDVSLALIELEAREWIADLCSVPAEDGDHPPTILRETLSETFTIDSCAWLVSPLYLSRKPVVVATVTLDDADLVLGTDYRVEGVAGTIYRLSSGADVLWSGMGVVVAYQGGQAAVPATVKSLVGDFVRMRLSQQSSDRDPLVKSERNEGVSTFTYFDQQSGSATLNEYACERLHRYSMRRYFV